MIDIHTHILPNCDDGSPNIETSLNILQLSAENGVTDIVLTPHFMMNQYHNTYDVVEPIFTQLQNSIKQKNIEINLHLGREIYLENNILPYILDGNMLMGKTHYLLVETGMNGFPTNFKEILFNLVRKGYKLILAHPERYSPIMQNIEIAADLIRRDVLLQLNAASFLGGYGKQVEKTAWKLLEHGFAHFLASDNHCRSNNFPLTDACRLIAEKYDDYLIELLTVKNPALMLKDQKIDFYYLKDEELPDENIISKIFSTIFRKK